MKDYFTINTSFGIISRRVIPRWDIEPGPFFAAACAIDMGRGTAVARKKSGADADYCFAMPKHAHEHVLLSPDYPQGQQL